MSRSAKDLQFSSDAESDHPDHNTVDHSKVTNRGAPARHSRRQRSEQHPTYFDYRIKWSLDIQTLK
ncbi:hypothetical protein N7508_004370 [Penicillium antarcticum]|uniref:uncharacterized protein n=1 Tax=Penicillium antarcticum TaxID=416450 RepID=UPI00239B50CC|nr:uncharacterized protein N7508_004370 [Penicillium antarcticum]KAJ5308991.1 hypothetical protein N7508_004370 [Penicillium antarcticum]